MTKLLYPFSIIYELLSNADRFLKGSKSLPAPVISIGNLTWGGTGKTPVVIELLRFLVKNNLKPAVLTRGYNRGSKVSLLVRNGGIGINAAESGDEPLLIAKSVPEADIIIGADRYNNALRFAKEIKANIYVLDDGFQHWKIRRNLDIVCVNAANPFGNGMLIPAGILREKPKALKRAGLIIITNADMIDGGKLQKLESDIKKYSGGQSPVVTYYGNYEYTKLDLKTKFDIERLKQPEVNILSGIGFSDGFKNSVEKSGLKIKQVHNLKDHQKYDYNMLKEIYSNNDFCVITAKDAVKLESLLDDKMKERTAVLNVTPQFKTGKEQWEKAILQNLK
ncbi:MAG: tetraacyldisaccharide 4'-kinase [Endomicrobia bacterium]|nr:tetraacyldisaccharide 4'-kinase [Endomicrobiia bacterium]MCL2506901.1 tetraacyldisaccharide 4'-kinase [Endomicrobiia bacterium]